MTINLYNSDLALATRITVVLSERPHLQRSERGLAAIDFLTTNAAQFDLYPTNLHGDSIYVATEFAARTQHIHRGIRYAVTHGLIIPTSGENGIRFSISHTGQAFLNRLSSQYLSDYRRALNPVLAYVDSRTERDVIRRIEQQGANRIKEDRT